MTTTYDFDVSSHAFKHFYQNQTGTGGSIPVFRGLTRQRGYCIGGIFSKMFQRIAPVLKNVARSAGKQLVKTGATDVIDGNNLKKSAISNLSHGGQQLISSLTSKLKTPKRGGVKRKSTNTSVKKKKQIGRAHV
mgnify:CR=1 FL=1